MPAPDWVQKMLCIILPNRRTVSPEFFLWVRTWQLLSCHTCPVRSPSLCEQGKLLFSTFLTRNKLKELPMSQKKRVGCHQQEQLNLPPEYSVFYSSQCVINNRNIKMRRWRESQISNSLTRQNNDFARASHFFVPFFAINWRNCLPIGHNNTKHFLCPIRSRHPLEFLELVSWESVPRGSFTCTWKLSSRPFSQPDWLPLGLRGCWITWLWSLSEELLVCRFLGTFSTAAVYCL